jgi:hypothetical protein
MMTWFRRLPAPLRPLAGSLVLVAGVRLLDAVWQRRSASSTVGAGGDPDTADTSPDVIRDRLVYSVLLSVVTAFAGRVGMPEKRSRRDRSA